MMISEIYNYLQHNASLHSSGMPTPKQILTLAEEGVQVVINLATVHSEGWMPDEQEQLQEQKIAYYGIPVDWELPTQDDLNKFMAVMDKHKNERVLVHCQANYRATCFIALYRFIILGWSQKNAFNDVFKIWDPAQYPVWKKFIDKSLRAQS
jgi:protein tyrosine phosphatase (PTP) superfamily phosphohydrolase (DUF442 family)